MKDVVDCYTSFDMNKGKTKVFCGFSGINNAHIVWRQDGDFTTNTLIYSDAGDALEDFNTRKEFAQSMGVLDSEKA